MKIHVSRAYSMQLRDGARGALLVVRVVWCVWGDLFGEFGGMSSTQLESLAQHLTMLP
jgi:hypothetical protein